MTGTPKNGLLLSSDAPSALEDFHEYASRQLGRQHALYAYLLHAAVKHFSGKTLSELVSKGLHLHICSLAAEKHGIPFSDRAIFCGLGTLASIIRDTDSFACFSRRSNGKEQAGSRQTVLLAAEDPIDDPGGHTSETLRVAAGLAQLSGLAVHLQLRGNALSLFDAESADPDLIRESLHYLRLLRDAGGTLSLSQKNDGVPIPYQLSTPHENEATVLGIG